MTMKNVKLRPIGLEEGC